MDPEHWRKVDRLCQSALKIDESRRMAFLDEACGGDPALRQEVASLLAHAHTDSFLAGPALETAAQPFCPAGTAIGRYRLLRPLGQGGMGVVYEAEQDQPRRVVALKLIKPGFATAETLRRFQHESQALGRLQHPGIAQIYEASTADTGFGPQPYFAMELIRGFPLHEYSETRQLKTRERLELMAKVCDAVEHAHQRGVIHRDLKPGNILVDETGQPKIVDFGVARVTESDAQHTRQTDLGQLVGTLAYMSPEQVTGDPLALDTRSDVYSLGVILFELLAGRLPYEIDRKRLDEAVGIIREQEPARLSSVQRGYRGDIETIAAKALEKDKARRYASAADLASDIRHYLADEPIRARPASASYQLRKFGRRHKALVAGTAAVFLVLVGGVMASMLEAVRARDAERVAEAVNSFLQNDLLAQASSSKQAGSNSKPDPHLEVRTALDRAAARISGKFERQPEVEASIRDTMGQTYIDLGLYPDARKQFERVLELERRLWGAENPKTLNTMRLLARTAALQGNFAEAEELFSKALNSQRQVLGPEHPDSIASMRSLAESYRFQRKLPQAEKLYIETLEISKRVLGPENPGTLECMHGLGFTYMFRYPDNRAEVLLTQVVELRRRVLGPEHPDTLKSMNALIGAYDGRRKYAEAEALATKVLEIDRRLFGPDHQETMRAANNLGVASYQQGKYEQSAALFSQVLEMSRRLNGPQHNSTLLAMGNLAESYTRIGRFAEGEALFRQTLDLCRRLLGPDHPYTPYMAGNLASMYQRQRRFALAEKYALESLSGQRLAVSRGRPTPIDTEIDLAVAYLSQGKFVQAEPLAREVTELYRKEQPDDWQRFRAECVLGEILAGQKRYAEAEPLLMGGYRGMTARLDHIAIPDRYHYNLAHEWVVQLYRSLGKPDKAVE